MSSSVKSFCFASVTLAVLFGANAKADQTKPNIIVFYTDDHGHADLSCQQVLDDIRTPNVDALARSGVLARHGYSTAPQCVPSRAGLLIGKFQSKFGVESNGESLDGFNAELTIAERLQAAGYVTAQFGKWHLGTGPQITEHGFKHVFNQNAQRPFASNITLSGKDRPMSSLDPEMYHVDGCSRAAASVIERYKDDPFFLYVAYRAPHVPLDATKKYLDRFPGEMPERRRQALAMLSAVDDGVGLVLDTLQKHGLREKTLVFYIGDNGAPLKIHKADVPGGGPGWDGSLNDPLNGEKGMLAEGGMHVPFVISWPTKIPGGQVYDHPISALDVAATATAIANIETGTDDLDGVNLIPFLTGEIRSAPHDALMWRWVSQAAIREGKWKLLRGGDREYLYDLNADIEEKHNLASTHPDVAERLRGKLVEWSNTLSPPGLTTSPMSTVWNGYFDYYLDGKPAQPLRGKFASPDPSTKSLKGWVARGTLLKVEGADLAINSGRKSKTPFLAKTGMKLTGPVMATLKLKSQGGGKASIAWRTSDEKDFLPNAKVAFDLDDTDAWQTVQVEIPAKGQLIHVRLIAPAGSTLVRQFDLRSATGENVSLW
tara:strand:+ start:369800 stop:371602 length:1803 start_codon:yes stop_codon:yes gene_type:complete